MTDISKIAGSASQQAAAVKRIDWYKCTPEEIKKYEAEGMQAPPEIVKWAQEIAKISAAPDDVTYEMVNGEVDEQQLAALMGEGPVEERKDNSEPDSLRGQYEAIKAQIAGQVDESTGTPYVSADQKASLELLSAKMSGLQNTSADKAVDFSAEIKDIEELVKIAPLSKDDAQVNAERDKNEDADKAATPPTVAFGGLLGKSPTEPTPATEPEPATTPATTKPEDTTVPKPAETKPETPPKGTSATNPNSATDKTGEDADATTDDKVVTDPNEILKRKQKRGEV